MKKRTKFIIGMATAFASAGILVSCGGNKNYKVTFVTDGGTSVEPIEVEWGKTISELPTTTKEGYTFTNWYSDAARTNVYNTSSVVETDITLYAGWSVNQYTVSFSTGVEGLEVAPITQNFGTTFQAKDISRDSYLFGGWFYDQQFQQKYSSLDKIPGHNVTLYARWIANKVTVKFNKNNDAATGTMDQVIIAADDATRKLPECGFKVVGATFIGWSTEVGGEIKYNDQQEITHFDNDSTIELFANWELNRYHASFFNVNAEGQLKPYEPGPEQTFGSVVQIPSENPSYTGYVFEGWGRLVKSSDQFGEFKKQYFTDLGSGNFSRTTVYDNEDISGKNLYEVKPVNMVVETISEDNNFYPCYVRDQFSVKVINKVTGETIQETKDYYNAPITLASAPAVEGYNFVGFFKDEACTNILTENEIKNLAISSSDVTFYAGYEVHTHKLVLYREGAIYSQNDKVSFGSTLSLPDLSGTKEGYEFTGWYEDDKCTIPFALSVMPDVDVTLYAGFRICSYNFTLYDGASVISTKEVEFDKLLDVTNPTKEGYEFKGWYSTATFDKDTEVVFENVHMPAKDFNVYAKFEAKSYVIRFENVSLEPISVKYGESLASYKPVDPEKPGYTFVGWKNGDADFDFESETMPYTNIDLKAVFTANAASVKVSYWSKNVAGTEDIEIKDSTTISSYTDATETILGEDAPEITGFTFASATTVDAVKYDGSSEIRVTYTRNSYTVTFTDNDATNINKTLKFEEKLGGIPADFEQKGYSLVAKIDGEEIDVDNYSVTGNITIVISKNALTETATFHGQGGLVNDKSTYLESHKTGEMITLPGEDVMVREGYSFLGWSVDSAEGEIIATDSYEMPADNIDFYAHWQINQYKLKYVNVDGAPVETAYDFGSKVTIFTPGTKLGYVFEKYTNNAGTEFAAGDTFIISSSDDVLTAHWIANEVKFVFNGNDNDTGTMSDQTLTIESASKALNKNAFGKTGYSFVGWALTSDGAAEYADEEEILDTEFAGSKTVNLYAVWSINEYSISFDSDGGSEVVSIVADYGETVEAPEKPTKAGYDFAGWYDKDGKPYYFTTMPANDVELVAHWAPCKYNLVFDANGGYAETASVLDTVKVTNFNDLASEGIILPGVDAEKGGLTRVGFTFDGWYYGDTLVTQANLNTIVVDSQDIILVAHWTANTYTISYHSNPADWDFPYDSTSFEESYKYGDPISKPEYEDPHGLTVAGWYLKDASGNYTYFNFDTMPAESFELFAKLTNESYNIRYYNGDGDVVWSFESSVGGSFNDYIKDLYKQLKTYEAIYQAIQQAAAGDTTAIQLYAAWGYINSREEFDIRVFALLGGNFSDPTKVSTMTSLVTGISLLDDGFKENLIGACQYAALGDMEKVTEYVTNMYVAMGDNPLKQQIVADFKNQNADMIKAYSVSSLPIEFVMPTIIETIAPTPELQNLVATLTEVVKAHNPELTALLGDLVVTPESKQIEKLGQISAATTKLMIDLQTIYGNYKNNAYNPYSNVEGAIFDGWSESLAEGSSDILVKPTFIEKATPVTNVKSVAASASSVEISWDVDPNAYGYYITYIVKNMAGDLKDSGEQTLTNNNYVISNLAKGDIVNVTIVKLSKAANGQYRPLSNAFDAISVEDGTTHISVEPQSLDSDPVTISYIHTTEEDMGRVSKVGDYYYVTENGTYCLFTNTSYSFGTKTLEIVHTGDATIDAQIDALVKKTTNAAGENVLDIKNLSSLNSFSAKVNGELKNFVVREIPDSIVAGSYLAKYQSIKVTNRTKDIAAATEADFLAEEKETLKVGAASIQSGIVVGSKYNMLDKDGNVINANGFRFDIDSLSASLKKINMDLEYNFKKWNGSSFEPVTDPENLYIMDKLDNGDAIFYFKKNSGKYQVTIQPKADVKDSYVNTFVPNIFKSNAKAMQNLSETFEFELTDGVNIYDSLSLKEAVRNSATTSVIIQQNIEVKLPANSIAYVPYAVDLSKSIDANEKALGNDILGTGNTKPVTEGHGDVDIVNGTAIMTQDTKYGPKIWEKVSASNANAVFYDANGDYYAYNNNGASTNFVIKEVDTVSNFDNGKFKTIFGLGQSLLNDNVANFEDTFIYNRYKADSLDIKINGNYFDLDASKVPFIRGTSFNAASGAIATYEIQNLQGAFFANKAKCVMSINNVNMIGNTVNQNEMIDPEGHSQGIAEVMRQTSGGLSGIKTDYEPHDASTVDIQPVIKTSSVNITNTLIAAYIDRSAELSYTHIKNSWANGVYSVPVSHGYVNIDHSIIESSGGCATQDDDNATAKNYGISGLVNPTMNIDFSTSLIENFVSGEEQWFKGYSMEVVALGLKSQINQALAERQKTIIKEVINPATGLPSECMNWVYFCQTNVANKANQEQEDMFANFGFPEYLYAPTYSNPATNQFVFAKLNPATGDPIISSSGKIEAVAVVPLDGGASFNPLDPCYIPNQGEITEGDKQSVFIQFMEIDPNTFEQTVIKQYVYVRINQPGFGYLQTVVEVFDL